MGRKETTQMRQIISPAEDLSVVFNKIRKAIGEMNSLNHTVVEINIKMGEPVKMVVVPSVYWRDKK